MKNGNPKGNLITFLSIIFYKIYAFNQICQYELLLFGHLLNKEIC